MNNKLYKYNIESIHLQIIMSDQRCTHIVGYFSCVNVAHNRGS